MDKEEAIRIIEEGILESKKGRFRKRDAYSEALKLMRLRHIISIVGVRRCGKSTLMRELVRHVSKETPENNILYLNLEHPFFNQYKEDVNNLKKIYDIFYERTQKNKKIFVFFDEIQFFKDWQVFIKYLYEKNEAKIIITGSNSRLLSSELATLLSGRAIPLPVYPFSLKESKLPFEEYLQDGGFPEIVLTKTEKQLLAETYYKNILYQDVIPRFGIKNAYAIENLSYYLLSNIGKELSYNTLKSLSNLDDKTVKQYMSYLQDANMLYILNNYDFSLKRLIGNKKKVYCVDPIFTQLSFKNSPDKGRLFENFVYMFLRRNKHQAFFHKNGGECDFILKKGAKITQAIQVSIELNMNNREREIQGLGSAMEKFKLNKGIIVTKNQNEIIKTGKNDIEIMNINTFMEKFGIDSEN